LHGNKKDILPIKNKLKLLKQSLIRRRFEIPSNAKTIDLQNLKNTKTKLSKKSNSKKHRIPTSSSAKRKVNRKRSYYGHGSKDDHLWRLSKIIDDVEEHNAWQKRTLQTKKVKTHERPVTRTKIFTWDGKSLRKLVDGKGSSKDGKGDEEAVDKALDALRVDDTKKKVPPEERVEGEDLDREIDQELEKVKKDEEEEEEEERGKTMEEIDEVRMKEKEQKTKKKIIKKKKIKGFVEDRQESEDENDHSHLKTQEPMVRNMMRNSSAASTDERTAEEKEHESGERSQDVDADRIQKAKLKEQIAALESRIEKKEAARDAKEKQEILERSTKAEVAAKEKLAEDAKKAADLAAKELEEAKKNLAKANQEKSEKVEKLKAIAAKKLAEAKSTDDIKAVTKKIAADLAKKTAEEVEKAVKAGKKPDPSKTATPTVAEIAAKAKQIAEAKKEAAIKAMVKEAKAGKPKTEAEIKAAVAEEVKAAKDKKEMEKFKAKLEAINTDNNKTVEEKKKEIQKAKEALTKKGVGVQAVSDGEKINKLLVNKIPITKKDDDSSDKKEEPKKRGNDA